MMYVREKHLSLELIKYYKYSKVILGENVIIQYKVIVKQIQKV